MYGENSVKRHQRHENGILAHQRRMKGEEMAAAYLINIVASVDCG